MTIDRAIEILNPEPWEHYDGMDEVNEACRMGMEALERSKWIPCSERLPEICETANYLAYLPSYGAAYVVAYYPDLGEWICGGLPVTVTHWMPLPEPPKEGGTP